jgi:hypothetical protein
MHGVGCRSRGPMQHQSVLRERHSVTGTTRPAASPRARVDVTSLDLETAKPEISGNDGLKADVSVRGAGRHCRRITRSIPMWIHREAGPRAGLLQSNFDTAEIWLQTLSPPWVLEERSSRLFRFPAERPGAADKGAASADDAVAAGKIAYLPIGLPDTAFCAVVRKSGPRGAGDAPDKQRTTRHKNDIGLLARSTPTGLSRSCGY